MVDPLKGKQIELTSGTKIDIPAGTLQAEGKVEVKVREFPSQASAFLAGIPMDYQKDQAFTSAGMLEIRALQGNKAIELDENKPIEVSMKLQSNPKGFDFWKLDETKKDWIKFPCDYALKSVESQSTNQQTSKHDLQILTTKINQNENKLLAITSNLNNLKEPNRKEALLPIAGNQRFVIEYDETDFKELAHLKGVEFEVETKEKYDRNFTKKTWEKVDLAKKEEQYLVTFSNGTKDKITLPVRPVLKGVNKDKAESEFNSKFSAYENEKKDLEIKQQTLQIEKKNLMSKYEKLQHDFRQSMVQSSNPVSNFAQTENQIKSVEGYTANFKSTSFGIFNCDRPISYPRALGLDFICKTQYNHLVKAVNYYLFDQDKKVRYDYGVFTNHSIDQLGLNANNINTLIIVDENGKMSFVKQMNKEKIKNGILLVDELKVDNIEISNIQKLINESKVEI